MPSIDGLASGLDTTSLIQQLMQLERQPQRRLEVAQQLNDFAIQTLKGLNAKFLTIKTSAEALTSSAGWQPVKGSSSDEAVAFATASAGAKPASLTFEVMQLASAGSAISTGSVAARTDIVASGATIDLTKGTDTRTISVGDGSLNAVIDAINAEKMGVTATAVQVSPGEYKLQLSSTTTGVDTGVSVSAGSFTAGTLGDMLELSPPRDATIEVGGTNPYTVTRSSNTMSDLLDGVTLTLRSLGTTTVTIEGDTSAMTASVRKLVDNVNATLAEIRDKTTYDTTTKQSAVLTGDGMIRGLQSRLLGAVTAGVTVDGVMHGVGEFGITVERTGRISLDEAKLAAAYEEDPALVEAVLGGAAGLAGRIGAVATVATASERTETDVGLITGAIKSRERQSSRLTADIKTWDSRLELREQALVRQFTSLETALAQAQSQGQWLASQLSGLQANMNS